MKREVDRPAGRVVQGARNERERCHRGDGDFPLSFEVLEQRGRSVPHGDRGPGIWRKMHELGSDLGFTPQVGRLGRLQLPLCDRWQFLPVKRYGLRLLGEILIDRQSGCFFRSHRSRDEQHA